MPAPVLAAPLVIPFAEAIGVSIAALGMAKATDKVNEFIQENPEQSIKIFQMIMPSQGIANALKNKSSEGDEEVSEDMDVEVKEKPKLTGKEKSEKIKAAIRRARAGKGNYSSPDAEGSAVDIRGSVIREVEDMGLADKDLKDKPYKEKGYDFRDYIPRGAYKKRYADGGAIGIEVLFEEKKPRKDFNIGGNVQSVTTPQPYDARASAADFARAIDRVGAGTDMQKARSVQEYGQNVQRQNMLSKIKDAGTNLAMQAYGLNPTKAGIAQDPSMLEFQEIKTAGLPQKDYATASTYGMLEDMTEGNAFKRALAGTAGIAAVPLTYLASPIYDTAQAGYRAATNPDLNFLQALKNEKVGEMMNARTKGALQFVGDQFGLTNNRQDIVDSITKTPTPDAGASSGPTGYTNLRKFYNPFEGSTPMTKEEYENKSGYAPPFSRYVGYSPSEFYPSYYLDAVGPKTQEGYDSMLADLKNYTLDFGNNPYNTDLDTYSMYQNALDDEGNPVGKFTNQEARDEYDEKKAFRQSRYNLGKSQLDNYFNNLASGGRVGLFMGGSPLDGQALAIYNSMNAYGFSDQEIADALAAQGLYTPGSSTPVVEEPVTNIAPNIINQGGGGDGPASGPTFNRNDLLGTPDYFPAEPFSFKDTVSDIGDYIKGGGIIGAGIRGLKSLFSRNTKNYVTTPQIKARDRVEAERIAREEAARQEVERQAAYAQARQDRETYKDLEASITSGQGGQGFDRPSSGPTATGAGMGVGGGYASDYGFLKNGGRVGYKEGGLAAMFKNKR